MHYFAFKCRNKYEFCFFVMEHARPPSELSLEGNSVSRADAWKRWRKQFHVFLKASGVHKEEGSVQASLLINLIGTEGFDVYETFKFSNDTEKDDVTVLLKKFDEYFGVKPNVTLARYNFYMRNQEGGESIDQYVTALKLLSKTCEFKTLEDEFIRDRIVCGVKNTIVRDRLLRTDDLTMDKAIKICQVDEVSADSSRVLQESRGASAEPVRVDAVGARGGAGPRAARGRAGGARAARGGRGGHRLRAVPDGAGRPPPLSSSSASSTCLRCGGPCVSWADCPAVSVQCYVCQNYGHFARMCQVHKGVKKLYDIGVLEDENKYEPELDDDWESFYISTLIDGSKIDSVSQDWFEVLRGEWGSENFKLDSGADINVLSFKRFVQLGNNPNNIVVNHKVKLQSYSGDFIPIKGICNIKWWYKNVQYDLKFAIADIDCQSVLGLQACLLLGLIKRIHDINFSKNSDLFTGLGCLPGEYHITVDRDVTPVVCAPRKVPLSLRDNLKDELDRMTELGVIRKVTHPTPWVNSLVVVAKTNGKMRICLDPRPLNKAIQRAHFQLPTINELATKLNGAKYFSVLDANSGFWSVKLDKESADLCTFITPFGRYQYLRLPFGLNCAPEVFHAKLKQLLEGLDGVESFIDDIIVWGSTRREHDVRLNALFQKARDINLKFNKDKCRICVDEVTYLGHIFNKDGMKVDTEKVRAVINMPEPTDCKSLERFLGAINYLSKFIPNYSQHIFPLTRLLKKDVEWCWEIGHKNAFDKLKKLICEAPVLSLFDVGSEVLLSVDASSVALGAVLMQRGRPVEYASRTLTDTQQRYAQIEKEMLAIVFACEKFHQYIYGKRYIVIETDHKPLESIFKKPLNSVPARLQRMMLKLQGYDLKITYKPGKYMYIPDTLSRAPLPDLYDDKISKAVLNQLKMVINNVPMSQSKLTLVKKETSKDEYLKRLLVYINEGWPVHKYNVDSDLKYFWSMRDELYSVDGVIFKDKQVLIPNSLKTEMLKIIHDGHLGIDRCKRRAREVLFWPGISNDIESYIKKCKVCQENSNKPSKEPMIPITVPKLPWNKVGTDLFEYGKKHYLILVDYYSGFIEVSQLRDTSSNSVIKELKQNFARYGIPETVVSDNGPQYSSRNFKKFAEEWCFNHITSSPYYAQSNGKSERSVQTIKKMLKKSIDSRTDFYLNLLSYNNTPRENLNSPAQLLMGRRLNCRLPVHPDLLKRYNCNDQQQHKTIIEKQLKSKMYYDQHCKEQPELSVGDDVIMLEHNNERMRGTVVGKASAPRSYIVKNKLGIYRRNRRHLIKNMPDEKPNVVEKLKNDRRGTIVIVSDESSGGEYEMSVDEDGSVYEPSTLSSPSSPHIYPPTTRSRTKQNAINNN